MNYPGDQSHQIEEYLRAKGNDGRNVSTEAYKAALKIASLAANPMIQTQNKQAAEKLEQSYDAESHYPFCEECGCRITKGRCKHGVQAPWLVIDKHSDFKHKQAGNWQARSEENMRKIGEEFWKMTKLHQTQAGERTDRRLEISITASEHPRMIMQFVEYDRNGTRRVERQRDVLTSDNLIIRARDWIRERIINDVIDSMPVVSIAKAEKGAQ